MSLPFIEQEINGTQYKAHTMNLAKWAELSELLADILGEPLGSLLRGESTVKPDEDLSLSRTDIQYVISGLAKKLSAKTIMKVADIMGNSVHADGLPLGKQKQALWWPNHMADLAPVVRLFLEAQYADFYEGLSDSLPMQETEPVDHSESTSE